MGIMVLHNNAVMLIVIMFACSLCMCSPGNASDSSLCIEKERQALFVFKHFFEPSDRLSSWTGQDCCSWDGALCNNVTGHVMELKVRQLVRSENNFSLHSVDWLPQLSNLQTLDLSSVDLRRVSNLSRVLNSLPLLSTLSLNKCNLVQFPLSSPLFTNLTNIKTLELSRNNIIGQLPDWLSQLPNIQSLDLSRNFFSGSIPSSYFTRWSSLKHLNLDFNKLNGTIPESIGQASSLIELHIANNFLSGLVSEIHFDKLSNLILLDMSSNFLAMKVSEDWVPPFQLHYLHLGSLRFENGFSHWLQTQNSLWSILTPNAIISGSRRFEDIVPLLPPGVIELDLSNCSISGSIPQNIGNLVPHLGMLILSRNSIEGSIPASLCGVSSLSIVDLAENCLSGDVPPSCWSDSRLLQVLDLSSNNLSGSVPSISIWSSLISLHLNDNRFSGGLTDVAMGENIRLTILDLANNGFSGNLPAWIGGLPSLQILKMRSNKFNGTLGRGLCALSYLQILDLAHNDFTGTIPPCFGDFKQMTLDFKEEFFPDLRDYSDRLSEVIKGRELEYSKTLVFLVNLDLSSNNLTGHIPNELTSLSGLHSFNISWNKISGMIPESIGNLKSMESLDFSHNSLTGMIPHSLSELNFLSHLNFSYNKLSCKIPTSWQLQTLLDQDPCGTQIEKKYEEDHVKENGVFDKCRFYIGLIFGFVCGFWGVNGILFFKRTWRHACFRSIENMYDILLYKFAICVAFMKKRLTQPS